MWCWRRKAISWTDSVRKTRSITWSQVAEKYSPYNKKKEDYLEYSYLV